MLLQNATWPEIETYLQRSRAIVVPIGSTEQHGPTGVIGTDALCPQAIAQAVHEEADILVAPTFNVGQAQHHMGFTGTITLRPSTMIAAIVDWVSSFARHGFDRVYFLNGHGGNIATIQAAFAEIYHARSVESGGGNHPRIRCFLRSWWEFPETDRRSRALFGQGLGSHATPAEVAITWAYDPANIRKEPVLHPVIAPDGDFTDAVHYRQSFPDGRIGSDPALASVEAGQELIALAGREFVAEFRRFAAS